MANANHDPDLDNRNGDDRAVHSAAHRDPDKRQEEKVEMA